MLECPYWLHTRYYRALLERNRKILGTKKQGAVSLNNVAMQLRKLCNHPYLLEVCLTALICLTEFLTVLIFD